MRSHMLSACRVVLATTIVTITFGSRLIAGTTPTAPEIDGSSISAGLGLLAAGVLIVRSRWHRK
jgi:hypothetical protein